MTKELTKQNGDVALSSPEVIHSWASAPVDVLEGAEEYLVFADVPGAERDDIEIKYAAGELRLCATRRVPEASGVPAQYRRSFRIKNEVDADKITAKLESGVLRVTLPKADSAKPRTITVQAA